MGRLPFPPSVEGLAPSRALHCRGVALYMQRHAQALGLDPEEAALCGWLHDIGYLFGDNRTHAALGGRLLRRQGYAHWREVAEHGSPAGLFSPLGVLLNAADMSVGPDGGEIGFDARLDDVAVRYGAGSDQLRECSSMIGLIERTGEWAAIRADGA